MLLNLNYYGSDALVMKSFMRDAIKMLKFLTYIYIYIVDNKFLIYIHEVHVFPKMVECSSV